MLDRDAVLEALAEYANKPATSRDIRAEPGDVFGRPPLAALMQFAQSLGSRAELNTLLAEVAPLIRAELFRGSVIALNCGTLVEMGGDPDLVFSHLLAELPRHLVLARRAHDRKETAPGALFDDDPDAAKAASGLRYLLLATMTVICRKAEYRQALRANPETVANIAALRERSPEADFVSQVLILTDNVELLVLVPEEQKGFRVVLEAVNNNFHLFTLLQAALILGGHLAGEPPEPEVLGVATGETPQHYACIDHARWHFYTGEGLRLDGSLDATNLATWIPGEDSPANIPTFDGVRVVILGPMLLASREWNSNEFVAIHDALRSRVEVVKVLSPEQVLVWCNSIQQIQR